MKKVVLTLALLVCGCTNNLYDMNRRINSYQYTADTTNYMKEPAEFYKDGGGDCEDFANAKRQAALELGYPESKIFFVHTTGRAHARLEVDGKVLDNENNHLKPASVVEGRRVSYEKMKLIASIGTNQLTMK